jgi:hypothetical protein
MFIHAIVLRQFFDIKAAFTTICIFGVRGWSVGD